ncbi:CHAT domain-containing protein [Saccharopolyspora rhizosphaerae]|uniref:CHAT domain-containing protein n=1 Tax=Saccharopolyspora rhizosphaerae TaxID=2492662 RepID=A0A426JIU5_9PSEU|nr:CHAT domain-containing protein [Saccharopolyspora rhizosphaerae]RRO13104.1 CHAT domain-containing protein [Saccharopolyspora rhizosphaerae]
MSAPAAVAAPGAVEAALRWRDEATATPRDAMREAERLLGGAAPDGELRVLARHIAALAAVELGKAEQARKHAWLGLCTAQRGGWSKRAAQLQLTLAWIELERGDIGASWANLAAAEPHLPAEDRPRATCVRGLLHCQRGQHRDARLRLTSALVHLEGDRRWSANALLGRGLANLYTGRLAEAEEDLADAERLFTADGRGMRAAGCRHNRGCVAFRAGDLPRALRLFEEAVADGLDVTANPEALVDRGEALAAAGLTQQARAVMEQAAQRLAETGRRGRLAETRLALAGCALRDDDPAAAVEAASTAKRLFRGQKRPAWAALASAVVWQAKLRSGHATRYAVSAARRAANTCEEYGWRAAAAELRLEAGRTAQRAGLHSLARKLLGRCAQLRALEGVPPQLRALGWLAEALLAEQEGGLARLLRACRAGLKDVDGQAVGMAAFEMRVHALGLADELGEVAVRAALRIGDPQLVLRWTERSRASALHRRSLRPPSDPRLNAALVRLRGAVLDAQQTTDPQRAMDTIAELEEQVRHQALLVEGRTDPLRAPAGIEEISAELGDAVLLSLFAEGGTLFAVSIVDGELGLHALGPEAAAENQAVRLRHLLARQACGVASRAAPMFEHGIRLAASQLQAQLLAPVLPALGQGRGLVVVPTGRLHQLPWSVLPACSGKAVTVSPSVRCWLGGAARARKADRNGAKVWIAGPRLDHAEQEVVALQRSNGGRLLTGEEARTDQVLSALDGAQVAHLAAHGHFRDDQPLLSCLDLDDGPLYAHDLDGLRRSPTTVVLSACDVGKSAISKGDQLSGLTATLLERGTATVVASVVPVPDDRTVQVMLTFHEELDAGRPPSAALAKAQARHGETGFICIGYGGA